MVQKPEMWLLLDVLTSEKKKLNMVCPVVQFGVDVVFSPAVTRVLLCGPVFKKNQKGIRYAN